MNGVELLTHYKCNRSEEAFEKVVSKYTNFVYSVAKRRLAAAHVIEDAVQTVFMRLAQAAPQFKHEAALIAWLHRTTVHVSIDAWRSESRRKLRELNSPAMEMVPADDGDRWEDMSPHLDEALNELDDADRQVVLLRFFQKRAMRDIGQIFGVSEDAAKMRVSRAIDRLRSRLLAKGVVCSVTGLVGFLGQHVVEAAPSHLADRLRGSQWPAASTSSSSILGISKMKLIIGASALLGGLVVFKLTQFESSPNPTTSAVLQLTNASGMKNGRNHSLLSDAVVPKSGSETIPVRLMLHVLDAETKAGLAGANVRVAYFYTGGRGEGHEFVTDKDGVAAIHHAEGPGAKGMNVFVSIKGYVPKCIGLGGKKNLNYSLNLDRAVTIGGVVVDDRGQPIPGVEIRARNPGEKTSDDARIDFQTSKVITDNDGRWNYPYIPKDMKDVYFTASRDGYAVTTLSIESGKYDMQKLRLVLDRGFTVAGRVINGFGDPISRAQVKELHDFGHRRLATETDDDGRFVLKGLEAKYQFMQGRSPEVRNDGYVILKGFLGIGEPAINIAIQAPGLASQMRTIQPGSSTNSVEIVLHPSPILRGRVLDEDRNPIPGAVVRTDTDNHGIRKYEWFSNTDVLGRYEWDAAPLEPVLMWFEAEGFEWKRDVLLTPDGTHHDIVLKKKIEVRHQR